MYHRHFITNNNSKIKEDPIQYPHTFTITYYADEEIPFLGGYFNQNYKNGGFAKNQLSLPPNGITSYRFSLLEESYQNGIGQYVLSCEEPYAGAFVCWDKFSEDCTSVNALYGSIFDWIYHNTDKDVIDLGPSNGYTLQGIVIDGDIKSLDVSGLLTAPKFNSDGTNSLITELTLPSQLEELRYFSLYSFGDVKNITIPEQVKTMDFCCFIGPEQWSGDCNFENIYMLPITPPIFIGEAIERGCFSFWENSMIYPNYVNNTKIRVYADVLDTYKNDVNWSIYSDKLDTINNAIVWYDSSGTRYMHTQTFDYTSTPRLSSAERVYLPSSVTAISSNTFQQNTNLNQIVIPDSVVSIGSNAFDGCSSLTSITVPEGLSSIANYTFRNCSGLSNFTVPDSVVSIGTEAFSGCVSLKSINIPKNLNTIQSDTFTGCNSLESITYNKNTVLSNLITSSIKPQIKEIIFGNDVTNICEICREMSSLSHVHIPDSVTDIKSYAFYNCSSLTQITLPNAPINATYEYTSDVFAGCSSLTSITIPENIIWLGDRPFRACQSLTSIIWNARNYKSDEEFSYAYDSPLFGSSTNNVTSFVFGENVETIPTCLCRDLEKLTSVTIPDNVKSIGEGAFYSCGLLEEVNIGSGVTSIDYNTFAGCSSLSSIVLPDSIKNIGPYAFYDCRSLTSIDIPDSVISIGTEAFKACSLTSLKIPENIKEIGMFIINDTPLYVNSDGFVYVDNCLLSRYQVYGGSDPLIGDIYIKEGTRAIASMSLQESQDDNITSITLPESLRSISSGSFAYLDHITSINIPKNVDYVGSNPFYLCYALDSITVDSANTHYDSRNNCNAIIETATNKLLAGCKGTTIPDSVISIGDGAFSHTLFSEPFVIPDSVISIGSSAFSNSTLVDVVLPSGLTKISNNTFQECELLSSVVIRDNVKEIGDYAFAYCSSLASITVPNSVTSIEQHAFVGCTIALKNVDWQSPLNPYDYDFWGASIVDDEIDGIFINGSIVVGGRPYLTSATIPEDITKIDGYAFEGIHSLKTVTIPDSVLEIGNYAFAYTGLTDIYYQGTQEQFELIELGEWEVFPSSSSLVVHCTDGDIYPNQ